jgi:hypothetical protein
MLADFEAFCHLHHLSLLGPNARQGGIGPDGTWLLISQGNRATPKAESGCCLWPPAPQAEATSRLATSNPTFNLFQAQFS